MISLVVAVSANGVIGRAGGLPWRLRDDMAYFQKVTMGHPVVMGRKTYESIPAKFRPLAGRRNIVVSRSRELQEGAEVVGSLEEAYKLCGTGEIMVLGGGQIYEQALAGADRLYVTEVAVTVEGDAFFPKIDKSVWKEVSREAHTEGEWNYDWVVYEK